MNRIDACLSKLKAEGKKTLITFITAGDPSLDTTEKLVLTMFDNGADIIEIGVPFSDPIAEGTTLFSATARRNFSSFARRTALTVLSFPIFLMRNVTRYSPMQRQTALSR